MPGLHRRRPVHHGVIGYVYYEIPANRSTETTPADIDFVSYEQIFGDIDPALVGSTTRAIEYLLHEVERNIEITDAIREKARESSERDEPHLAAQMIYYYIIETYPYSHVPHYSLDARAQGRRVHLHVRDRSRRLRHQSMLLQRSAGRSGSPALPGATRCSGRAPGTHFWRSTYLPGYGWVPNDPTVAEAATGPSPRRHRRSGLLRCGLDHPPVARRASTPMDPALPDDVAVFRIVRQFPAVVSIRQTTT